MVKNISGVYLIRNKINQKSYVGSSANILTRLKFHLSNPSNPNLKEDIITFGVESFMVSILEFSFKKENQTNEEFYDLLLSREQFYLDNILKATTDKEFFLRNAYNINYLATGPNGITRSAATRVKYSLCKIGKPLNLETIKKIQNTRAKNHKEKIELTYGSMDAYKIHLKKIKAQKHKERKPIVGHGGFPIACYDLKGNFINRFNNQLHARIEYNIAEGNISKAISKGVLCKGMYWRLYNEKSGSTIEVPNLEKFILRDSKGNELGRFKSVLSMAKSIGLHHSTILLYLKKQNHTNLLIGKYSIDEIENM